MRGNTRGKPAPGVRRAVAAAVMAGALLAVGFWVLAGGRGPGGPPGVGGGHGTPVADAELVHFEQGHGIPPVSTVLRSRADVKAFAGWFPDLDIGGKLTRRDFRDEALIAFGWSGGCTSAEGARLTRGGTTGYSTELTGTTSYEECYAPWDVLTVFAVPRPDVPDDVRLGGAPPAPPGPAELLAFAELGGGTAPRAAEVSQPDQLERFLGRLPAEAAATLRADAGPGEPGGRRFAFTGRGCGDGAVLEITGERLRAVSTGEAAGAACAEPRPYAAVFAVPAEQVPPGAVLETG